jgi:hypothetical protein
MKGLPDCVPLAETGFVKGACRRKVKRTKEERAEMVRQRGIRWAFRILELDAKVEAWNVTRSFVNQDRLLRKGHILIIIVAIANHGNEATRIVWADEPPALTVRFVTFDSDGKARHGESVDFPVMLTRDPGGAARSHVIRAGATENLTFAFKPDRRGLYLLSFRGR